MESELPPRVRLNDLTISETYRYKPCNVPSIQKYIKSIQIAFRVFQSSRFSPLPPSTNMVFLNGNKGAMDENEWYLQVGLIINNLDHPSLGASDRLITRV